MSFDLEKSKIYFDEKLIEFSDANVSIASSAVLYGLSVYTVFPINLTSNGLMAFRLKDHFRRLQESSKIIGIDDFLKEWNYQKFEDAVRQLIRSNVVDEDVFVRATVHVVDNVPGTKSRGLRTILTMFIYPAHPILPQQNARLKTSVWRRVPDFAIPARAKVNGAYINSVLAKQDAIDSGYDDCVFLDTQGHVCELSAANIFLVRDGVLITPSTTSDLLEGINRRTIIELAESQNIKVEQRTVDLTELYIAQEVFACGTSAFVSSISEVDARTIGDGEYGELTVKLAQLHYDLLHGKGALATNYLTKV